MYNESKNGNNGNDESKIKENQKDELIINEDKNNIKEKEKVKNNENILLEDLDLKKGKSKKSFIGNKRKNKK